MHQGLEGFILEILNRINCSNDVKKLDSSELNILCDELRRTIIEDVSQTGGHLASNLGVVELTVALHRVYDTQVDRLVFDVGHQCYAHKMITGRLDRFDTLRKLGGISGFPKPCESADDACIAGHASTSISNALGMARSRTLQGKDYGIAVLIGDGAMGGGLAYEGLSDCGQSGEPIVVILNDNGMSIASNVGGIAKLISKQRVKSSYMSFKRAYRKALTRHPSLYKFIHRIKEAVKDLFLPDNMFEDLGFYYIGPVDGHDVNNLAAVLDYAKSLAVPVLLHVKTVKGKGYAPSEAAPDKYHGVGAFDPARGIGEQENKKCFSSAFGDKLTSLAKKDRRITAITAAMESGTGLEDFQKAFPERFFDVGIAEGHAVSLAAGMAAQGMKPVFAVYSSFLQRSYDMLIHDVAFAKLPVVLAIDRAGIVGADGETHNGCFDIAFLSSVPNMTIYAPSNYAELETMLELALSGKNAAAIRYPRGEQGDFTQNTAGTVACVLCEGSDLTIASYGITINDALLAAEILQNEKISCEVIKLNELSNPDMDLVAKSVSKTGALIVCEECCESGCIGVRIVSHLSEKGILPAEVKLLNLGSGIVCHGDTKQLRKKYGIDSSAICDSARLIKGRK